jgi:hypothetical protein
LVYGRRLKRYQCRSCGHQATLTAGTIMQATKLPLTTWFLAFYLIGQAKTGISSLELSRHLGVNYDTAWLLHHKILRAMADREDVYLLRGKVQIDDSYLGGELPGGKAGRGSDNKIPIVAAVSLNEAGHPIHARITAVSGFSSEAIAEWAKRHLAPGSQGLSDGMACFRAVTTAGCQTLPCSWRRIALVSPVWASEITSLAPPRPRSLRQEMNSAQKVSVSLSPTLRPSNSRRPSSFTPMATTTAREQTC